MKASSLSFQAAVLAALAGMVWGIVMAASGDHSAMPAHAHLNLLGWVSLFLFGIFYHLHPGLDRSRTAITQVSVWIAATVILNTLLPGAGTLATAAFAAAGGAAIATGLSGGNLGQILKSAAIAGATAVAYAGVGFISSASAGTIGQAGAQLENIAGHALVGCASSVASGGSCGSGALSAGVSAAAGPYTNTGNYGANLIVNAVVGGAASVAGGGKFANGAVTGAFGYLVSRKRCSRPTLTTAYGRLAA